MNYVLALKFIYDSTRFASKLLPLLETISSFICYIVAACFKMAFSSFVVKSQCVFLSGRVIGLLNYFWHFCRGKQRPPVGQKQIIQQNWTHLYLKKIAFILPRNNEERYCGEIDRR